MQDFDTLRDRVEETAQKLTSAQGERQQQTETLIGILRQLEEKYSAQEQQVAYYRDRVEPLEQANEQLSLLMGNLLDLIEGGFCEDSLAPMRKASEMATAMLATDMAPVDPVPAEYDEPSTELDADQPVAEEPVLEEPEIEEPEIEEPEIEEPEIEAAAETEIEPDTGPDAGTEPAGLTPDQVLDLIDDQAGAPEAAAGPEPEDAGSVDLENTEFPSVATDFEMEEEALAKLEEDIDPAAEDTPAPPEVADAPVEMTDMPVDPVEMTNDDAFVADETREAPAQEGPITVDEIVSDAEMLELVETGSDDNTAFEDVSAATLELELEEDAAAGMNDLPELVQIAAAAAAAAQNTEGDIDTELTAPADLTTDLDMDPQDAVASGSVAPEFEMEADAGAESAAEEAEAIAAIAEAIESESNADNAAPPAPADIRSLLLRVEALAKKAEAMRMAQDGTAEPESVAEDAADADKAGGAPGQKKTGTAA